MNHASRITHQESGYALIATLGALTVMLILISGTISTVAYRLKRERETEMLFRGRQIVEAIARYQVLVRRRLGRRRPGGGVARLGIWPRSLEELADGISLPGSTRKVRLLRRWALRDPMNHNRAWKPVSFGDPALEAFLEAYFTALGRTVPPLIQVKYLGASVDLGDDGRTPGRRQPSRSAGSRFSRLPARSLPVRGTQTGAQAGRRAGQEQEGFIFGVVSESPERPLRDYYGLERYNQWVFVYIPELPAATGDEGLQMLTRQVAFPSDPLLWRMNRFARASRIRSIVPSRRIVPGRRRSRGRQNE